MATPVSIIILCYNKVAYTKQCLRALYANTDTSRFELIVVDNASSDSTPDMLAEFAASHPNVKVIRNEENLGFVGGNNCALGSVESEYVIFLNNDTEVQPGWLPPLVETMAEPGAGAAGCKLVYPDGTLQEAGGIIYSDATGNNFGKFDNPKHPEYCSFREVDYCSGAALMVRADLFRELGGFDARYQPAYYEDTDLCFTVREKGLKVFYEPRSVVVHHEGKTAGTDVTKGFKRFQEINREKFIEKWRAELEKQPAPGPKTGANVRALIDRRFRGKPQVLASADEPPQYDRQGGALRFYHFLQYLVESGHQVTYLARNVTERPPDVSLVPYVERLRRMGVVVHGLNAFQPSKMDVSQTLPPIQRVLTGRDFEAALLFSHREGGFALNHIKALGLRMRIFMDSVDLHFLRKGRECRRSGGSPSRWVDYAEGKAQELATYRQTDCVFTATAEESDFLQRGLGIRQAAYVPDTFPLSEDVPGFDEREGLVFLAGFRHAPNLDAAMYLMSEILPHIRKELGDVPLYLVGDGPPDSLKKLADEHTVITGWVPKLEPYLSKMRVGLVPINYGAGIKGKLCRAMGYGTPNVSTTVGAEGIGLTDEKNVLLADDPASFAKAVARLYNDRELWERLSRNGYDHIRERHSRESVSKILLSTMFPAETIAEFRQVRDMRFFDLVAEGYVRLESGRQAEAQTEFRNVIELYPGAGEGYIGLARTYLAQGKAREAQATLARTPESETGRQEFTITQARCLLAFGRKGIALKLLNDLASKDLFDVFFMEELGTLQFAAGGREEAQQSLERALTLENDMSTRVRLRTALAEVKVALGDVHGALEQLAIVSQMYIDINELQGFHALDVKMGELIAEALPPAAGLAQPSPEELRELAPVLRLAGMRAGRSGPISSREYQLHRARPDEVPGWLAEVFAALDGLACGNTEQPGNIRVLSKATTPAQ
ncbi:glycosyltransferase [Pseudodesulfovibrio indicus]|uniref:glycosyltransferase n=1 Tax=Pseudodesulfovibrio indicus TaxID=1716143 RepID=UPI00292E789B|nr:glycosyltransferase [Pseudodesulfovibrio indicus]